MASQVPAVAPADAASRRVLATRDAGWAIACARRLARHQVRPNLVSVCSVGFAAIAGVSLAVSVTLAPVPRSMALLTGAACVQLRLLCNLLDGMLAVEHGLKTPTGDIFNDVPDRIADVLILVGAGYGAGVSYGAPIGWLAAVVALFTAYVRVLGGSLGVRQPFIGPMAKQQRMFTVTVAALLAAAEGALGIHIHALAGGLAVIVAGSVVTAIRRTRRIAYELKP